MSNESLKTDWVRKQHSIFGIQFETFGPKFYDDKVSHLMQKISQGKPAQKAILDGISRKHIKLVIEYGPDPDLIQAEVDPSGRVHTIKFNPDAMTQEVLFQHRDTKRLEWVRVDTEEILIHELYHVWLNGGEAQLVTIGTPSAKEIAVQEKDPKETIVAEGYAIRYVNTIREANGSRWMRLTHEAKSHNRGSRLYFQFDGPGQGFPIRGYNR